MNVLLFDFNNVLADVEEELKKRGHILLPIDGKPSTFKKADVVVLWNETDLGGWKDWIKEGQKKGKKFVLMQHGRRGTSRIFPPFNEELVSDVLCAWGENDRDRMISCGVKPEKIVVTGTTVLNHVKPRMEHEGLNVVFSPEHWDTDVVENAIIKGTLDKLKGVKVITKCLEGEHDPNYYTNPVVSNRSEKGHLEICADVLATADLVVAVSESTFELMAEHMDIPVVIADIWIPKACAGDDRYKEYNREYSNACTRVKDINKLNDTIMYHLKHPEILREERKQIAILDGGTDIENPLYEICNVIERIGASK
jgi:hypothetical protein